MISQDSPLRRLPLRLDERQVLFFDAIRVAIEMIDASYGRLCLTAGDLGDGVVPEGAVVLAMQDAWSVIDSVNRLRRLVRQAPGVKQNAPGFQQFVRGTSDVETLRDAMQHLEERVPLAEQQRVPLWGTLGWLSSIAGREDAVRTTLIVPGTTRDGHHRFVHPTSRGFRSPLDQLTLSAFGVSVNLSHIVELVAHIASETERSLQELGGELETRGSDMLVHVEVKLLDAPETAEADAASDNAV